jgi:transposase
MGLNEETDRKRKISDFRFGIIADLVYIKADRKEITKRIAQKVENTYDIPFSSKTKITASCIRKWLAAFKRRGRDSLVPKDRNDKGVSRSISDAEKESILGLLEKKPHMAATTAVRQLLREGGIAREISKSSLSRFLIASGFDRSSRMREVVRDQVQPFGYRYPLECVQVDAMHSFLVPDHRGKLRKAILIAFLDDATRRVLYSHFSFTECALEFERGILHILRSYGRPARLYTDNGSTFVSDQTQRILDTLGIPLIHSRPGKPKGRGKIERSCATFGCDGR